MQNRYRIETLLNLGAMGAMYRAWDTRRDLPVVIKELDPQSGLDPPTLARLRQRFDEEASALSHIDHPHLADIMDFFHEDGSAYLVTEFIDGESLSNRIKREGALPEADVLVWAEQILDALAYCHSRGVLHRDIKPQNIIIRANGDAVLVDFGIVKLWDPYDPRTWTAVQVMGTPEYAAPEQWGLQRGKCAPHSDLYSLGATLYYALTGQPPFTAGERMANPYRFLPVQILKPRVSPETGYAVVRAMELPRGKRFQSAEAMLTALREGETPAPEARPAALILERPRPFWIPAWVWVLCALIPVAALVLVSARFLNGEKPAPTPVSQSTFEPSAVTPAFPTATPQVAPTPTPTCAPTPPATATARAAGLTDWPVVFYDDFSTNAHNWLITDYEDDWGAVNRVIADGVYRWEVKALKSVGRWCMPDIAPASDFYLSVEARRVSGAETAAYGLVFRHREGSYYLFSVRDDGSFRFSLWNQTDWITEIDWTETLAARPGETNRLTVVAEGAHFTFYINDERVGEAENDRLSGGEAGLAVMLNNPGDEATFEFDYFELRSP